MLKPIPVNFLIRLFIVLLWTITIYGCQSYSTRIDEPVVVDDQEFLLNENCPKGTIVGQIVSEKSANLELTYYLVSTEYSDAFEMGISDGFLILKDSSLIDYEKNTEIPLEVMVGYDTDSLLYGVFANVLVKINDSPDPYSLVINDAADGYQEALIEMRNPDENCGQSSYLYASAWTNDLQLTVCRSFLQFDLSVVPKGCTITEAFLSLYNPDDGISVNEQSTYSGSNAFDICKVTSSWNSGSITWNNQPSFTTERKVVLPASKVANQNYENIDITSFIQGMVDSPEENYGLIVMLENETYYRRICFASMHNPNENLRPKLKINYLK
jgi:hypothetical protein